MEATWQTDLAPSLEVPEKIWKHGVIWYTFQGIFVCQLALTCHLVHRARTLSPLPISPASPSQYSGSLTA